MEKENVKTICNTIMLCFVCVLFILLLSIIDHSITETSRNKYAAICKLKELNTAHEEILKYLE